MATSLRRSECKGCAGAVVVPSFRRGLADTFGSSLAAVPSAGTLAGSDPWRRSGRDPLLGMSESTPDVVRGRFLASWFLKKIVP